MGKRSLNHTQVWSEEELYSKREPRSELPLTQHRYQALEWTGGLRYLAVLIYHLNPKCVLKGNTVYLPVFFLPPIKPNLLLSRSHHRL